MSKYNCSYSDQIEKVEKRLSEVKNSADKISRNKEASIQTITLLKTIHCLLENVILPLFGYYSFDSELALSDFQDDSNRLFDEIIIQCNHISVKLNRLINFVESEYDNRSKENNSESLDLSHFDDIIRDFLNTLSFILYQIESYVSWF